MSIMKKAEELAEEIVNSSEYEDLKAKEEIMQGDEDAQKLLKELQAQQQRAQMAKMNGQQPGEDLQNDMKDLHAKMEKNEKVKDFMEAQDDFNKVMQTVNQTISSALQGDQEADNN
ncbi:MAG: YlbF family regulator [Bacillota bacterium]